MSFLAPWFIAAAVAAVSLPVLFHLFRRTPQGRLPFSTLMFLAPSPPRLTSRSRLENWPLLLLRALVLVLLGLSFGRPLWRHLVEQSEMVPTGRRTAVLLDASASMRRGDLWDRALAEVRRATDAATPHDELCLIAFDASPRTLVSFEAWRSAPPGERSGLVRAALIGQEPSWSGTRLDDALISAVELLDAADGDRDAAALQRELRIVLVGDLQSGARTAGLQTFEWPKRVSVEVVGLKQATTNVGLHALENDDDGRSGADAVRPYVLLTSAGDASRETFTLAWKPSAAPKPDAPSPTAAATGTAAEAERPVQAYVPPGKSRTVRAPPLPPGDVVQLVLAGDDEPFDNTLTLVPPVKEQVRVLHLSAEKPDDPQSLRYFLERAFAAVPGRQVVTVETVDPDRPEVRVPSAGELDDVALIVIPGERALSEPWTRVVAERMHAGAVVVSVVASASANAWQPLLPSELLDPNRIQVAAGSTAQEYALLGTVDLRHPLFAPFNDPRYSDFSKIRFWRHRKITLDAAAEKHIRIAARFDSGDPAIVEVPCGAGRLVLFAAGWQPQQSQLGVSSKFVPLVATLVELGRAAPPVVAQHETGATVDLRQLAAASPSPLAGEGGSRSEPDEGAAANSELGTRDSGPNQSSDTIPLPPSVDAGPWTVTTPGGGEVSVTAAAPQFTLSDGPGLYEIRSAGGVRRIAANVPVDESKTAPLGDEALEALGVRLAKADAAPTAAGAEEKRNLQALELESRQQLWRWCLAAALGATVLETWYAGRSARRETSAASSTP